MSQLLERLEQNVDHAIETIGFLQMQVEELVETNKMLLEQNHALKEKQSQWEQGLSSVLQKLSEIKNQAARSVKESEEQMMEFS